MEISARGFRPLSNTVMKASAISAPVIDWLSRYQCAIQLSAPARAKAVILGSQGWIEPSWIPSRSSRRMPWSISDFIALMWALMSGERSWSSARTMHQPNSEATASP